MRLIGWLLLILMGSCWLASEVSLKATEELPMQWRRTVDGWELKSSWTRHPAESGSTTIHPAVVGVLQIFLAVTALIAFSREGDNWPSHGRKLATADPLEPRHRLEQGLRRLLHHRRAHRIRSQGKLRQ
ncbi:MAG TPA: hypothetical protein VE890_11720 [Thermoguttaceae bacterium]|nr:hypothetical protein [Thermoguttaceae bacterium]